jgi:uncharacterized membrane protein
MQPYVTTSLLWFAAIGCGLMAGVYFAFSAFIMAAFARIGAPSGIVAMNAINDVILRSLFMPLFITTTLAALLLFGIGIVHWDTPGAAAMAGGGGTYVVGMFAVTMVFNVPLNNALASADTADREALAIWSRYLTSWNRWNHVRTIASTLAVAAFIFALVSLRG